MEPTDPGDVDVAALVEQADGASVTREVLVGDDDLPALVPFLRPDERPQHVLRGAILDLVDRSRAERSGTDAPEGDAPPRPGAAPDPGTSRKVPSGGRDVLTLLTDRRLLVVVPRDPDAESDWHDVEYDRLEEVRLETLGGDRRLVVNAATEGFRIDVSGSSQEACETAAAFCRRRLGTASGTHSDQGDPGEGETDRDPLDVLERLADLKERGAITEAEFDDKKAELLDRI